MAFLEQLLANGLVVFGTTVALVLLFLRGRARRSTTSPESPELPRAFVRPALRFTAAMPQAPVGVEPDMAESLLAAARATTLAPVTGREPIRPFTVGDRAAFLHQISVSHVQAAHPVFRPRPAIAAVRSHAPSAAHRPASVVRQEWCPGTTRPQRAPLHLVHRAASIQAAPLQ